MAAPVAKASAFCCWPAPARLGPSWPPNSASLSLLPLRRSLPPPSSVGRRRRRSGGVLKPSQPREIVEDEQGDNVDEDAFEALFKQLEEDLKNDDQPLGDSDDEITEEDLARLEQELADALGEAESHGPQEELASTSEHLDDDDEDDDIRLPKLKNWQLRRLSRALKIGRRKTSIKNLAAELGLERAVVLDLLRDPPPSLLLMSASLPDEPPQVLPSESEDKPTEHASSIAEEESDAADSKPVVKDVNSQAKLPVHVMRRQWFLKKRLKKVQVQTLEKVYLRTKRPTNAMISSIVHVTNLPRKKVIEWFEGKRNEDGVPEHRGPYRRAVSISSD